MKSKNIKDGFVKIISIPQFVKTNSIVLLDLQTMESQEVKFDISKGIFAAANIEESEMMKRKSAFEDSSRPRIEIDTQMIDWTKIL